LLEFDSYQIYIKGWELRDETSNASGLA